MKKVNLIFSLIFIAFMSCNSNEDLTSENKQVVSEKISQHFSEINRIKEVTINTTHSIDYEELNKKELKNQIIRNISKKGIDYSFLGENKTYLSKNRNEELTLADVNLSEKANFYFNRLEELNTKQDFQGVLLLLNEFNNDYSKDSSDLESLIGVFSIIEIYKSDILSMSKGECISGNALGGAAISGAISGAIWGFKLGSWLGPAGTALGTIGGAIAGATISTIVSIGVQGIRCESQQQVRNVEADLEKLTEDYIEITTKNYNLDVNLINLLNESNGN